ncbi:PRC-barrel protein [Sphingomonas paucimobilis]|nr:PRC-barrel protein [Sphingomonas paucimobilis]
MEDIAGWVAPVATMIAAMMTAANLGARITGWGFVVFTVGSIAWSTVGFSTGQTNLLATNLFLTLVNAVGIWRWLGRQRAYEDGGKAAQEASRRSSASTLFTATGVAGMPVHGQSGEAVGKAVEALVECESGNVSYVVVASGGIGGIQETLRAVARNDIGFECDKLTLRIDDDTFQRLPVLEDDAWPAKAPVALAEAC